MDEEIGKVHYGFVSLVNAEDGFCYIKCQNSEYDSDIFVHQSVVDPSILAIGDEVACSVELRANTPRACKPVWRLQGHKGGKLPELGEFTGKVMDIDEEGNGFVECEEFENEHGTQACLQRKVLLQCRLGLGDVIGFHAQDGSEGVEINAPCWFNCSEARKVTAKPPTRPPPASKLKPAPKAAVQSKNTIHFGRVKFVDEIKGFSHVFCPDSGFDNDVYVKSTVAPPREALNKGDIVAFTLGVFDSKPQAVAPLWRLLGEDHDPEKLTLGTHVGRLVRKTIEGDAFVESDALQKEYGRDAFVSRDIVSACGMKIGDVFSFLVSENSRGMPQIYEAPWKFCSAENIPNTSDIVEAVTGSLSGGRSDSHGQSSNKKYYVGNVVEVDEKNGFSAIECPETGFADVSVCAYADVIEPTLLEVGDSVAFRLHVDENKVPCAVAPCWRLASRNKSNWDGAFAEWIGRVQDQFTSAGDTFIICDEIERDYQRMAYTHSSMIEDADLNLGGVIAFNLHISKKGHPQVTSPIWKLCSDDKTAPEPGRAEPNASASRKRKPPDDWIDSGRDWKQGKGKSKGKGKGKRNSLLDPRDFEGAHVVAWVNQIDEINTCYLAEIPGANFERDVFVPFSVADNLCEGDTIFFMLHTNKSGRPSASKFDVVWKLVHTGRSSRSSMDNEAEIGTYRGIVKEINHAGGAHIECPELVGIEAKEAYAPMRLIKAGLSPGDMIFFDLFHNDWGKTEVSSPCWKNVSPYEPPDETLQNSHADVPLSNQKSQGSSKFGEQVVGHVKSIDLEREHSMVDVPDSGYDRDVWVYKIAADPKTLSVGDMVFFQLHENSRGYPQASAPLWKLVGPPPEDHEARDIGTYTGKVRDTNADGSANVECPDIDEKFGNEALIQSEDLDAIGLQAGDVVMFDVSGENDEGMPLVCCPMWKGCSEDSWLLRGPSWQHKNSRGTSKPDGERTADDVSDAARRTPSEAPRLLVPKLQRRAMTKEKEEETEAELVSGSDRPMEDIRKNDALEVGDIVEIHGLRTEAGKKLNGFKVTVVSLLEDLGKVQVQFLPEEKRSQDVRLSPANLRLVENKASNGRPSRQSRQKDSFESGKLHTRTPDSPPAKSSKTAPKQPSRKKDPASDWFFGRVRFTNEIKGFSSVDCHDSGFDVDVNVKSLVAPPNRSINKGDLVGFKIDVVDGRPNALAPLWKLLEKQEYATETLQFGTHTGKLARKSPEGDGFAESEAIMKEYGRDAFISRNIMTACMIDIGDTILFNVVLNNRGFPQVMGQCWKCCSLDNIPRTSEILDPVVVTLPEHHQWEVKQEVKQEHFEEYHKQPGVQNLSSSQDPYYVGCVVEVDTYKGSFFIDCPETGHKCNVLAHRDTADPSSSSSPIDVGDFVAFPLRITQRNLPHAKPPLWKCVGPPRKGGRVCFAEWIGKVLGVADNGNVFIECEDLRKQYNRSPIVYKSIAAACDLVLGETIGFSVQVSPNGQPQVISPVWRLCSSDNWTPAHGAITQSHGYNLDNGTPAQDAITQSHGYNVKRIWSEIDDIGDRGSGSQQSGCGKGKSKGKGKGSADPKDLEGHFAVGWIKHIDEAKSFYMAEVPGIDRDVFMHFSVAGGLNKGDTVFFMLHANSRGQPQTSRREAVWKLVGHSAGANAADVGQYTGTVKEINRSGGAHIDCPELKQQVEAYATAELMKAGLQQGDKICFDWKWNDRGKIEVTQPCWKSCSQEQRAQPDAVGEDSSSWNSARYTWQDTSSWNKMGSHETRAEPERGKSSWVKAPKRDLETSADQPQPKSKPRLNPRHAATTQSESGGVHAVGWVKTIHFDQGFVMVEVPDSGYDGDVTIDDSVADPAKVAIGDTVFFEVREHSGGAPTAVSPVWKLVGMMSPEMNLADLGTYKGTVRAPNIDGSANVDCLEVDTNTEFDPLISPDIFGTGDLEPGDIIFFDISGTTEEGMPLVCSPLWKSCSDETWTHKDRIEDKTVAPRAWRAPPNSTLSQDNYNKPASEPIADVKESNVPEPVQLQPPSQQNFVPVVQVFPPQSAQPLQPVQQPMHMQQPHDREWGPLASPLPSSGSAFASPLAPAPVSHPSYPSAVTPQASTVVPPWHARLPQTAPLSQAFASPVVPLNPAAPPGQPLLFTGTGVGIPASDDIEIVQDEVPLEPGELVEICGLTSEAGSPMNGLQVTVVKIVGAGRVQVRFHPDAKRPQDIRLKALNLRRVINFGP